MTRPDLRDLIERHLDDVLVDARFAHLPGYSRGKVRDCYDLADGRRIIVTTDRQSAFDRVLAAVPFKGQILNETARFWFEATGDLVPNHVLATPDPNVMVVRRLSMLPVEVVVRDYLAGTTATSIWPMYRHGGRRMYGLALPDGLRKNQKLPETILTPTTKGAAGAHDEPVAPEDIVEQGLLSRAEWSAVAEAALALFDRGRTLAAERGLILVDTKYEFGRDAGGRIVVADEIHTPDSSRYWLLASYRDRFEHGDDPETLDKDFLRRWIVARCDPYREPIPAIPAATLVDFGLRYVRLFETVTGRTFVPADPDVPPRERVRRALDACLQMGD
jgi:phosphoribosylaminoimidazole-succinocarboxamide synthase